MVRIIVDHEGILYLAQPVADGKSKCGKCLRGNLFFINKRGNIVKPRNCPVCGARVEYFEFIRFPIDTDLDRHDHLPRPP